MHELTDKCALIVGDDEISRGIATRFTRAGAAVALGNVNDAPQTLDILVISPLGSANVAALENLADEQLGEHLDRVRACAATMRAVLPLLRARGGGRIILVGHHFGERVSEGIGAYNTAAWSLLGLVRTAAVEWGAFGITTNLLIPFADTAELRIAREKRPKIIDLLISQIPLRRAGDPIEDIGGATLFLASDDGAFINGQVIYADGGQHVAGPVLNPVRFASS